MKPTQTYCRAILTVSAIVVAAASCALTAAQDQPASIDPAVAALAARIAEPLQKGKQKRIVVADLKGPGGQFHPFGHWAAGQLSAYLKQNLPNLEMIDSPRHNLVDEEDSPDATTELVPLKEKEWARELGASVLISGSYAKVKNGIGVSLFAVDLNALGRTLGQTAGLIPLSNEIAALSPDPIPSPKPGTPRAGVGGVSVPACTHCPAPKYSSKARAAKYQGTVTLLVTISPQGRAVDIAVVKGPGMGLEENSIAAVRNWKFKPAQDPEGNPVAALVPIEVSFSLY